MPYRSAILAAIEDLKDHQTGSSSTSIRKRIKEHDTVFAAAVANAQDDTAWNENLFQSTLKSLVSKRILDRINGTNYKYSDDYLTKRAEGLRARAASIEEHRRAAASAHTREEPPKELPARKTVHAKVKMNEGKIITVMNPSRKHNEDEMETDDEEGDNEVLMTENGKNNKKHSVKIIPRKVGAKKMLQNPM